MLVKTDIAVRHVPVMDGVFFVADQVNHRIMRWEPAAGQGSTVAGGNGSGSGLQQLNDPTYVAVDHDGMLLVADTYNHRIMRWEPGAAQGSIVAGGIGSGSGLHQFYYPYFVAVDHDGMLLVADRGNHRIMRWEPGAAQGSIVAGGNGRGSGLHQLDHPTCVAVDHDGMLLVADSGNHRIMRWEPGAAQGSIVAGGIGSGSGLHQFYYPYFVAVDHDGMLLVADRGNHRIMRWEPGAEQGSVVAGGNGRGIGLHQLINPFCVAVDHDGMLLVADEGNNRIMRWEPGAAQGSIMASGFSQPICVATAAKSLKSLWAPEINSAWPHESKVLVKTMLLIDRRRCHCSLTALGSLLTTHVLPLALPLRFVPQMCRSKMCAPTRPLEHNIVAEEVQHEEPPASISVATVQFGSVSQKTVLVHAGSGSSRFRFIPVPVHTGSQKMTHPPKASQKTPQAKIVRNWPVEAFSRALVSTIEFLAKNYTLGYPQFVFDAFCPKFEFFGPNVNPKNGSKRFRFTPFPVQNGSSSQRFRFKRFRLTDYWFGSRPS